MAWINNFCSTPSAEPIIPKPKHGSTSTSSLHPEAHFTNHESLPSSIYAFSDFIATNPRYTSTQKADRIRDRDYSHLSNHIRFDYTGVGLFSHSQLSSPVQYCHLPPSFFKIACKSVTLKSQLSYGSQETALEASIKRRIMDFLKISDEQYTMVCAANKTSALKILAESYPFRSNKRLLAVYDHENEAVRSMEESAKKRGAKVMSAEFCWPSMKIHSEKLKKMVSKRNKKGGLFVFPSQSQMTGSRYPYQWMSLAQENGWHVVLDACSFGPKDMNTLGLSLIEPDFIICSFFKIFGEDPSGFTGLFIKRSSGPVLEMSSVDMSTGVISIIPPRRPSNLPVPGDVFATGLVIQPSNFEVISPSSDLRSAPSPPCLKLKQGKTKYLCGLMNNEEEAIREPSRIMKSQKSENNVEIECGCLDHADSLGLLLISRRLSCLVDWLVNALLKLKHPKTENERPLVRIYGPQAKLNRGSALAINLFDWKGEKIEPALVQKLADRSNISISCGFLRNIWFAVKYEEEKSVILGKILHETTATDGRKKEKIDLGVAVVNLSLNFLNNFEDAYRLWSFIAKFMDADFIEKERWRYFALNQTIVEI